MFQREYFKELGFQTSRLVIVISWAKVWFFVTIICMNTYHFKGQLVILAWLWMPLFSTLPWTFLLVLNWIPDIMCPLLNLSATPRGVLEASRPIHFHIHRHDMDSRTTFAFACVMTIHARDIQIEPWGTMTESQFWWLFTLNGISESHLSARNSVKERGVKLLMFSVRCIVQEEEEAHAGVYEYTVLQK